MTDLMGWLYDHYIHPQIENQPQDDADELHFAILESALMEAEKQDLEYVCRFYAVQGFRAGGEVRAGAGGGFEITLVPQRISPLRRRVSFWMPRKKPMAQATFSWPFGPIHLEKHQGAAQDERSALIFAAPGPHFTGAAN